MTTAIATNDIPIAHYLCAGELACKHCGRHCATLDLLKAWERLRIMLATPIKIVSGYRCPEHELSIERPTSQHTLGRAIDIARPNLILPMGRPDEATVPPRKIDLHSKFMLGLFLTAGFIGIGRGRIGEACITHLDVRESKYTFWNYRPGGTVRDGWAYEEMAEAMAEFEPEYTELLTRPTSGDEVRERISKLRFLG